jgi:hypothetical protein
MKGLIELLETAHRDMKLVKKDTKYIFDVNAFHTAVGNKCHVCVAGAIMAKTLHCYRRDTKYPWQLGREWDLKLCLIDEIRLDNRCSIRDTLRRLYWEIPDLEVMYAGIDLQDIKNGDDDAWFHIIDNLKGLNK